MGFESLWSSTFGWLIDLSKGCLDLTLCDLRILKSDKVVARGMGRVYSGQHGPQVEAYVTLEEDVDQSEPFRMTPNAGLVLMDELYELQAIAGIEEFVCTFVGADWAGGTAGRIHLFPLFLTSALPRLGPVGTRVDALASSFGSVLGRCEGLRASSRSHAGTRRWSCKIQKVNYSFHIHDAVSVLSAQPLDESLEPSKALQVWTDSVSVLCGGQVEVFGGAIFGESICHRSHTGTRGRFRPSMPPPVRLQGTGWQEFLKSTIRHMWRHEDSPLVRNLSKCWDTDDNHLEIRELSIATAIESLTNYVGKQISVASGELEFEQVKRRSIELLTLDSTDDQGHTEAFDRIRRIIRSAQFRNVESMLPLVLDHLGQENIRAEVKSWKDVRHVRAHGRRVKPMAPDVRNDDLRRCSNLLNRLVVGLVGYKGPVNILNLRGEAG